MITDLVEIRRMGEKKRGENEAFRRHLKRHDFVERNLRHIAEEIEDQIDCTACANCCRVATVKLLDRDVSRLAKTLRIPVGRFLNEYCEESDEGLILKRTPSGCPFLSGNLCTVYDDRPSTCADFPHLVRGAGSLTSRMWEMVDRATYCPIVYNALEAFKVETRFFEKSAPRK
ncbi:MAG: YkgJ family cysteine cluster protein [Acidobacteria bacterium]|nr:YkgJ family cysteine cluster protein [Acidobacteriota bacterium]